ncbi:BZ3500_MvSof-1268-A1-R1_Chr10-1g02658 [Microbotryum saponariae]|uniref:BZ3500_MvSof-1268-A1-R1_Chr10-1g02658 protein n=1 Tax=Microbotryum saponariae TaxID=289078 RepID=A0A2X0NKR6_9BASI|nr:BZ3500_MvSof-1268-A1-R1_Chr10-1g02658 [Microbotryum saponariae]SDA06147.1 BZ3501_MvSof-1269-A2-R1_Chr10-1g02259 [Microbotryum saponariae]
MAAILSPEDSKEFSSFLDTVDHDLPHASTSSTHHLPQAYSTFTTRPRLATNSQFLFPNPTLIPPPPQTMMNPPESLNQSQSYSDQIPPSFPSHAAELLDQEKLARMAQQTRELADWMRSRSTASAKPTTTTAPTPSASPVPALASAANYAPQAGPSSHFHAVEAGARRTRQASGEIRQEQSPNKRGRVIPTATPLMDMPNATERNMSSSSSNDDLARLKAAEEKAQFAQRYTAGRMPVPTLMDTSAATTVPMPLDLLPIPNAPVNGFTTEMMLQTSPMTMRPVHLAKTLHQPVASTSSFQVIAQPSPASRPTKRKTPATRVNGSINARASSHRNGPRASTSTTILGSLSSTDSETLNPGPALTPSNIPFPSSNVPYPKLTPRRLLKAPPVPPSSTSSASLTALNGGKPGLLTAEQKKANHIASEQKRRAAIRHGYETLCVIVPSLRAAIEEFDERVKKLSAVKKGAVPTNDSKTSSSSKTEGGSGPLSGGIEIGGEKIDGRAGPKSEAVVLGKTVDHLRDVLRERKELLERMANLYAVAGEGGVAIDAGPRVWDELWVEES